MAKLNNDARNALCNMVQDKAEQPRRKLTEALSAINAEIEKSYGERLEAARKELNTLLPTIKKGIGNILSKHSLGYKETGYREEGRYTFEDLFRNGELKSCGDLRSYVSDDKKKPNRKVLVEAQMKDLDGKVAKAKQEILLRAALGMKYDEMIAIVNGFQF